MPNETQELVQTKVPLSASVYCLDDFSTGALPPSPIRYSKTTARQPAAVPGGIRTVNLDVGMIPSENRFGQPASVEIDKFGSANGLLVLNAGARVYPTLQVQYGWDINGTYVPLNLNLSSYKQFRIGFEVNDQPLTLAVIVNGPGGVWAKNTVPHVIIPANANPFQFVVPFSNFAPGLGVVSFSQIDFITFQFSSSGTGGNDFVLTDICAAKA